MILTIIQARMSSTRLPGKILMPIAGKTILEHVYDAAPEPKVVAVPKSERIRITDHFSGALCAYDGDDNDVLGRFWYAYEWAQKVTKNNIDWIIRLTADCPMLTKDLVRKFIIKAMPKLNIDTILTNRPWDPDGYDCELFSVEALKMAYTRATDPYDREHVTPWLYRHLNVQRLSIFGRSPRPENPAEKVSVDTLDDYEKVKKIMEGK